MPPTDLPSNLTYGRIVGRFLTAVADTTGDVDTNPDGVAPTGIITFVPTPSYVLDATATPDPVTVLPSPITCTLDASGYLIDPTGARGVSLVATDDTALNPTGWTYSVTINIAGSNLIRSNILVPGGSTQDLTTLIPVPSSGGTPTLVGPVGPTGPTGPTGPAGPIHTVVGSSGPDITGAQIAADAALKATYGAVVMHGSTAGTARPTTSLSVKWVGSVTPTNATNGDCYLNTTTALEQVMVGGSFVTLNNTAYVPFPSGALADYAVATKLTGGTNGMQWTTKEELVARSLGWIIVTDARWAGGAKFDGSTDDGPAFRAAVAAALVSAVPKVIWMPPGQSVICSTQRTTATGTDASDGHAIAISGSNGGITFKGSGKYATQILHRGYGNVDPTTNWQNVGGNVWRGGGFWIDNNTPNINFEAFDLDGRTHKTGVTTFPANISTGDGWDLTHKGIWRKNGGGSWGETTVKDCRVHGYRGEIVYSGGSDSSLMEVRASELYDSNAGTISTNCTLIVEDNYLHDAAYGLECSYQYYQSVQRNRIETMTLNGVTMLPVSGASAYGPCIIRGNMIRLCDTYGISMTNGARNTTVEDNTVIDGGTTSSTWPYLFQTASGLPIKDLTVRRNRYLGITRNQPSSNGCFYFNDSGSNGVSNLIVEDNTAERTAEAVTNGFTVNNGFAFNLQAADLSAARIRNNRALGTTFCYTDQDQCLETLLANTTNNVVAKRRPDRLTNFTVTVSARVITAATSLTFYVSWYDATGTNRSYFFANSVSEPVGAVVFNSISFTAQGPNDISVNASAGTASQVYVTAKISETV